MYIVSINIGAARAIEGAGKSGQTGIFKEPVPGLYCRLDKVLRGNAAS